MAAKHKTLLKYRYPLLFLLAALLLAGALAGTVKYRHYRRNQIRPLSETSMKLRQKARDRQFEESVDDSGALTVACAAGKSGVSYTFWQLPMTGNAGGCGYAVESSSGGLIMIDGGYEGEGGYILDFIREHGGSVDAWFVTHPHFDHAGALVNILSTKDYGGVDIGKVYYNPFTEDFFHEEKEGKSLSVLNNASLFDSFEKLRLSAEDVSFIPLEMGQNLSLNGAEIACLFSFRPELYDVNANSLVLHINLNGVTFLITGDITDYSVAMMRAFWGDENACWDVDFLQIPHHGYIAGISDTALPELTKPSYAFLDCSRKEYETNAINIRLQELWYEDLSIPVVRRFTGPNRVIVG